jgi:hypothetical protein
MDGIKVIRAMHGEAAQGAPDNKKESRSGAQPALKVFKGTFLRSGLPEAA